MIGLIFIIFPVVEVMVFMKVGEAYGYFNAFMGLIVSFIVGLTVVQTQGRAFLMRAQHELTRGELPAGAVVQSALIFIGGLFLMVPGFVSDVIGILCIIPGPRHLLGVWARREFKRQLQKGRVHFFGNGAGFSAGFGFGTQQSPFEKPIVRDVSPKIIDVKPSPPDEDDGSST